MIEVFPAATESISTLMPQLRDGLQACETLKRRLFKSQFSSATLSGELLVTLIYHRPLDDAWEIAARELSNELNIQIIGRSRKQKMEVLNRDWCLKHLSWMDATSVISKLKAVFRNPIPVLTVKCLAGHANRQPVLAMPSGRTLLWQRKLHGCACSAII